MNIRVKRSFLRAFSLYVMAAFYFLAGCYHFIKPGFYAAFMPAWVPFPLAMIRISGFFELLFAVLLLPKTTRPFAAWGIIFLLIAVFPANIQLAINYYHNHHPHFWLTIVRLPVQFLLIWWAFSLSSIRNP